VTGVQTCALPIW